MFKLGIITVSDRSSRGEREDLSGPEISKWARNMGFLVITERIVPDEIEAIKSALKECSALGLHLIFTTGGTGFAPRDVTPEATLAVIDKHTPGFVEVMRLRSLEITPRAMLSRAVAGIRGRSLIINLPGSPKAVRENLGFIQDAIPHALDLICEGVSDCGSI
jgi:molybdopterin adenylyltransferase